MSTMKALSSEDMVQLVEGGEALPLLPEGVPGPVQYTGQWWAILVGEADYRPVTDPAQIALLDRGSQRYTAARTTVARARACGGPS